MERFHLIEHEHVITKLRGVYRQAELYRRGRELFAKHGGGFVKLCGHGGTSLPKMSWVGISIEVATDTLGTPSLPTERLKVAA